VRDIGCLIFKYSQGTAPTESYGYAVLLIKWAIDTTTSELFSYSCPSALLFHLGDRITFS